MAGEESGAGGTAGWRSLAATTLHSPSTHQTAEPPSPTQSFPLARAQVGGGPQASPPQERAGWRRGGGSLVDGDGAAQSAGTAHERPAIDLQAGKPQQAVGACRLAHRNDGARGLVDRAVHLPGLPVSLPHHAGGRLPAPAADCRRGTPLCRAAGGVQQPAVAGGRRAAGDEFRRLRRHGPLHFGTRAQPSNGLPSRRGTRGPGAAAPRRGRATARLQPRLEILKCDRRPDAGPPGCRASPTHSWRRTRARRRAPDSFARSRSSRSTPRKAPPT